MGEKNDGNKGLNDGISCFFLNLFTIKLKSMENFDILCHTANISAVFGSRKRGL